MTEEETLYCPKCWKILQPDRPYCIICGAPAKTIETSRIRPQSFGHSMVFAAGSISLLGGIANFVATASFIFLSISYGLSQEAKQAATLMAPALFVIAVLNIVGSAFGWSTGMHLWIKESFRTTFVEIAFLAFVGFLNLIEGVVMLEYSELSLLMILLVAFPIIILSLLSLAILASAPRTKQRIMVSST